MFWGRLPNTSPADHFFFGEVTPATAAIVRQWAELAYWFQSLSVGAGITGGFQLPGVEPVLQTLDFSSYGTRLEAGPFGSHSYMSGQALSRVWSAWDQVTAAFGRR